MVNKTIDNLAITEVYAFKKDSIITDYMAGDSLSPINTKRPFWKEIYKFFFSED